MGELKEWARSQSKFIKLDDGDLITAQYEGFSEIDDKFNPDKKAIRYKFNINGETKYWEKSSSRVAEQMDSIPIGSTIEISRKGSEAKDTVYTIKAV
jgi:hypothetical protein